jgi:hypothetical protein
VDAWSRTDDGEFGFDRTTAYEDRTQFAPETITWSIACTGGLTCNNQALSHGFVSEWYTSTTIYDLWDGPDNLQLNGPAPVPSDYDDSVLDAFGAVIVPASDFVELSFADIIQPILDNAGTGGFHSLLNDQEQFLINDFIQYHKELMELTFTAPLDDLQECSTDRAITNVFHNNGIRNLHSSLGTALFPSFLFSDFLNTDAISFQRQVETEFYDLDPVTVSATPQSTVFQTFTVDVTELHDSVDDFNFSSNASGDFGGDLQDDLLVTGTLSGGSARLLFNNDTTYGWQNAGNNFGNLFLPIPTVEQEFYVSLCGGMRLEANEGGSIILGNDLTTHSATVTVESGGILILGGGRNGQVMEREYLPNGPFVSKGKLRINAHSRVVIERGATLQINPGAEILLAGPEAVLEIRGDLVISDDANFTYTSTGGGYVLFDLPDNGGAPNVTMGNNASITLDEVPFTVAFDSYVRPDDKSGLEFTISNSTGSFQNNAYIDVSQAFFTLAESTIQLDSGAMSHKGIILNGAAHDIHDNTISGGAPGIYDSNSAGNTDLTVVDTEISSCVTGIEVVDLSTHLSGVTISGCGTGLKTVRGSANIVGSRLVNCGRGWEATELIGASSLRRSTVSGNVDYGLHVESVSNAELTIRNTDVLNNQWGVWAGGPMQLIARDSRFTNHAKSGMYLTNGVVLDMDSSAGNVFSRNMTSIELDNAGEILLLNGLNLFYPYNTLTDGMTIQGTVDNAVACSDPSFNPNIAAGGNTWFHTFIVATQTWLSTNLASSPYDIKTADGCAYTLVP